MTNLQDIVSEALIASYRNTKKGGPRKGAALSVCSAVGNQRCSSISPQARPLPDRNTGHDQ